VGSNESGDGIIAKIYGGKDLYYMTLSNIDQLLKDFNADSSNKLFCCLEEATPFKKGHRNNDQLGALITNQVLRVERKGLDAFYVNDFRAFCCCTNNSDAFKIVDGDRRHVLLEADDRFSEKALDEHRCTLEERNYYMTKLNESKTDEIAYEFFRYCMRLDISNFRPQNLYKTDLHREQMSQNQCVLKSFLEELISGEYIPCLSLDSNRKLIFTSQELFDEFKHYQQATGLVSTLDNVKSIGWQLKKYPHLIRKSDESGNRVKYIIKSKSSTIHTNNL